MAHFPVDTSRAQEQPQRQGTPVNRETANAGYPEMPKAPGNAKAAEPVPQRNATPKPVVAGVDRDRTKHPAIQEMRVPASSEYTAPPEHVRASTELPDHPA